MADHHEKTDEPTGSNSGDRSRAAAIGFALFTAACGIGLGMLTAPEAGRQTRKRLRKRASALGDEVSHRWDDMHDRFDDMRDAGMQAGHDLNKNVRKKFTRLHDEVEERWHDTQSRVADLEDRLHRLGRREQESNNGTMAAALGLAAGAGLAYFLIADEAEEARTKVQELATDLRRQAEGRWQEFRRTGAQAAADGSDFSEEI